MTTPIFTEELTYYADAGCLCVGDGAMKALYMNNCGDGKFTVTLSNNWNLASHHVPVDSVDGYTKLYNYDCSTKDTDGFQQSVIANLEGRWIIYYDEYGSGDMILIAADATSVYEII